MIHIYSCVFFSFNIISLNHVCYCISSLLIFMSLVFHCITITRSVCPFSCWWTLGLFTYFLLLEIKLWHSCTDLLLNMFSFLLSKCLRVKLLGYEVGIQIIYKKQPNLSKVVVMFTFPPGVLESSNCSACSSIFGGGVSFSNFHYLTRIKEYLVVNLIFILLKNNDESFLCA